MGKFYVRQNFLPKIIYKYIYKHIHKLVHNLILFSVSQKLQKGTKIWCWKVTENMEFIWPWQAPQGLGDNQVIQVRLGNDSTDIFKAAIWFPTLCCSTFCYSIFCRSTFCHSTFCRSIFCHSTLCRSTFFTLTKNLSTDALTLFRCSEIATDYWASFIFQFITIK
jgi:hypothetical protein